MYNNVCWTEQNEKDFIDGLLSGKFVICPPEISRDELLKNYIKSAKHRRDKGKDPTLRSWVINTSNGEQIMDRGAFDWDEVIRYAESLL